jgi:hypothetical protein
VSLRQPREGLAPGARVDPRIPLGAPGVRERVSRRGSRGGPPPTPPGPPTSQSVRRSPR